MVPGGEQLCPVMGACLPAFPVLLQRFPPNICQGMLRNEMGKLPTFGEALMKRVLMLKRLSLHKNLIFLNHLSSQYLLVMFVYAHN